MTSEARLQLHTGRAMPALGLGTWQLNRDTAGTVAEALRIGWRMIDTSGDYGTQPGIGEALRRSDVSRDEIYLVTKVEEDEDAYDATRRNLDELGQEWADLMLIHRPPADGAGEQLWDGLIRARDEGLATDIGVSNYSVQQMDALERASGELPVVNQIEWTPFGWSSEMLAWCADRGVVIQAYSPLTRGQRLGDDRLAEVAERHGASPAQILLAWALAVGTAPLPKANRQEHLEENLRAVEVRLTDTDLEELNALNEQASSLGSLPYI